MNSKDYKLIRITHIRCSEAEGRTYLFAPIEYTNEQIQDHIDEAVKAYLQSLRDFDVVYKPPVINFYSFEEICKRYNNTTTIQEIKNAQEEYQKKNKQYEDLRNCSTHDFIYYMPSEYKPYYEPELVEEYEADWGHNHGLRFNLNKSEPLDTFQLVLNKK